MRKILLLLWCGLFFLSGELMAQTRTLTGKVTDASGNPIPNASILVKGTNVGTVTNIDGMYSLNVPAGAKTLVISSVNMQAEEVRIGAGTEYSVSLKAQDANMQEVVVVGYSAVNKRSLTGSVATVKGEDVANKPVLSFDQALTGKAPGVLINTASGLVGDNVIIRIRGAASISSGSQPLIVLDGVPLIQGNQSELYNPVNALADINPNDIESVEVLKDASAAAIYGSRGSTGVIVITTKKGKAGQATLGYDTYVGFNENSRKMKVLNGPDYTKTINTMRTNAGLSKVAFDGDYNGDGKPDPVSTDWQDASFHHGLVQNHQLSVSGGSQKTTYYVSLNYNDLQNYIAENEQKRASVRMNLTSKATDWLTIGVNAQYSRTLLYGLGSGTGAALSGIPYGQLTSAPNIPVYDTSGKYYLGQGGNTIATNTPNPVAVQHMNYDNRDARRFIGSAFGEAEIWKGLKFKSQINVDYSTGWTDGYWNPEVGDGVGVGVGQTVYSYKNNWSWFNTLSYSATIGADHEISALAGSEYTRFTSFFNYSYGSGIVDEQFKIINASNYSTVGAQNGIDGVDNGLASYFGGLNYGYQKKYLATFNFRTDADSRFGKNNRWAYFPSGSVAWRITQEDFMQSVHFVNELKLRASYGITGNSNIGYYPAISTFTPSSYADIGVSTLSNPGNSNLKWERHLQTDVGFDAVIFRNTNVTVDYYNRKTKDLVLNNPVLATLGFPNNTITENIGQLQSQGVELSVGTPVLRTKDFNWNVNFNIAWNKTKVLATNDNGDIVYDATALSDGTNYGIAKPGTILGAYYLIRWAGVNPANGMAEFYDAKGNTVQYNPASKTWSYIKDGTTAPQIAATDRVVSNKSPYPKFYGGLSQTFTYKSFDASVDLQYALGFYLYDQTMQTIMSMNNVRNKSEDILGAWQKAGDNTNVPQLWYANNQWSQASTRWLEKGDFLRIRNVQIGYNFPKALISKIKVSKLRFYVQAQNLYTFTGYKGIDPEANGYNSNISMGVDRIRPYLPRTFTMGLNLGL